MNTIENNMEYGISTVGCFSNAISLNRISGNQEGGVYFGGSKKSLITGNIIMGNHGYGIRFEPHLAARGSPHENVITANVISNHDYGLHVRFAYDEVVWIVKTENALV
jgi:nitrous oxidase accessory protein NosD